jgi:hypothetical protein
VPIGDPALSLDSSAVVAAFLGKYTRMAAALPAAADTPWLTAIPLDPGVALIGADAIRLVPDGTITDRIRLAVSTATPHPQVRLTDTGGVLHRDPRPLTANPDQRPERIRLSELLSRTTPVYLHSGAWSDSGQVRTMLGSGTLVVDLFPVDTYVFVRRFAPVDRRWPPLLPDVVIHNDVEWQRVDVVRSAVLVAPQEPSHPVNASQSPANQAGGPTGSGSRGGGSPGGVPSSEFGRDGGIYLVCPDTETAREECED